MWTTFHPKQIEILGGGCTIRERHISNSVPKAGYEPRTTSLCYHIWMCNNITPCSLVPNPSNKTWYPDMRAVQLMKATHTTTHTAEPPSHSRYQPKWAKTANKTTAERTQSLFAQIICSRFPHGSTLLWAQIKDPQAAASYMLHKNWAVEKNVLLLFT